MESAPPLEDRDKDKSKLGNLLKANVVFLVFQVAVNIRNPLVTQYLYKRYSDEEFNNSTGHVNSPNQTSQCYVNESDPGYMLQEKVQENTSNCQTILTVIGSSGAVISCMFLGAYSDFLGRRVLFIVPLAGVVVKFWLTTVVIYWNLDVRYLYIGEALQGFSGGYNGVILASYAYTADNTPPKNSRTVWIAVIDFTTYLAAAASQVITGYFIKNLGYLYPSVTTALLMLLSLVLVVVLLPETINSDRRSQYPTPVKAVKNVFGFYFSKDFGPKRSLFLLSLASYFILYFSQSGVYFVEYLFQLNLPFCWGPELIGYFNMALSLTRQFLGIPVIKLLHMCTSDPGICIITSIIQAGAYVLHGLANTDVLLFSFVLPNAIAGPLFPSLRAIMSRMAPAEMQGSLFAGIVLVNIISEGIGIPVFNEMYNASVRILRGFAFFACAGCQLLSAVIIVVFLCTSRRSVDTDTSSVVGINDNDIKPGLIIPQDTSITDTKM
ncbi:solute carrier family 46 member 3-like isoform X1 [Haliotis rufescens]|uniref:solute carrier family 46 member 3-like isoform X1 n=1 Tax=Haliotis rufescens TaxID=6454 RepID=UPI00201EBE11|nr:solute carrier family 46 member 3-like isoform X1 [Haliotis rufescens]